MKVSTESCNVLLRHTFLENAVHDGIMIAGGSWAMVGGRRNSRPLTRSSPPYGRRIRPTAGRIAADGCRPAGLPAGSG